MPSNQPDDLVYEYTDGQMLELETSHSLNRAALFGMHLMLLALILAFVTSSNKVFWHFGLRVSQRLISMLGVTTWFLIFAVGARQYIKARGVWQMVTRGHRIRLTLWFITILMLAAVGVFVGNYSTDIGKEAVILLLMGIFLILGCDDWAWIKLEKPLVVMFYIALVLVIWGRKIGYVTTLREGGSIEGVAGMYVGGRAMDTLAANLKPLLGAGLFLGALGMVGRQSGIWRLLELLAIPAIFFVFVLIFKFRGVFASVSILCVMYLLVRPVLERKARVKLTIVLLLCGWLAGMYFVASEDFSFFRYRLIENTQEGGILESRLFELSLFREDMGFEILHGRGLGGVFTTRGLLFGDAGLRWKTLHFGVLIFLLKGGVWMFLLFISFIVPCLKIKPRQWYQNPYNLVATLMLPVLIMEFCLHPFLLAPQSVFLYLGAMFCLARFARREELDF